MVVAVLTSLRFIRFSEFALLLKQPFCDTITSTLLELDCGVIVAVSVVSANVLVLFVVAVLVEP